MSDQITIAAIVTLGLVTMTIVLKGRGTIRGKAGDLEFEADGRERVDSRVRNATIARAAAEGNITARSESGEASVVDASAGGDIAAIAVGGRADPKG